MTSLTPPIAQTVADRLDRDLAFVVTLADQQQRWLATGEYAHAEDFGAVLQGFADKTSCSKSGPIFGHEPQQIVKKATLFF